MATNHLGKNLLTTGYPNKDSMTIDFLGKILTRMAIDQPNRYQLATNVLHKVLTAMDPLNKYLLANNHLGKDLIAIDYLHRNLMATYRLYR